MIVGANLVDEVGCPKDADPFLGDEAAQHGIAISENGKWLCSAGTIDDYAAMVKLPDFTLATRIRLEATTCVTGAKSLTASNGRLA